MSETPTRCPGQRNRAIAALRSGWSKGAIALFWLGLMGVPVSLSGAEIQPTYVLRGSLTYADFQTYRLLPFEVPPGTKRLSLTLAYTGREQRTVIDLGLFDPERFRGWSGGNKSSITISEVDATPSYLPGPLPPGTWKVLLGIPNIRPDVKADYEVTIHLSSTVDPTLSVGVPPPVVRHEPAWYQGDLHSHTGHSDGSCPSLSGQRRVPCPEFRLLQSAVARGLDFLAVTDHNTTSTYNALLQWQPYFDTLLLMRGREITTFHGHANLYGTSEFIDFRLGHNGQTVNQLLDEVHGAGALISINHPVRPSGEECMGCGWTAKPETDFSQVDAIEVVNGPDAETRFSGIPFWEEQLSQGHRITAIGGSDVHQPDAPTSGYEVGIPTTVVYARELSEAAILEGVRAGHVYVKLKGPSGPSVLVNAEADTQTAMMGDTLPVKVGQPVRFTMQVIGGQGTKLEIVHNGRREDLLADPTVRSADELKKFGVQADGGQHWYRLNLRASDGTLLVLTNPIYLNFSARPLDRTLRKAK